MKRLVPLILCLSVYAHIPLFTWGNQLDLHHLDDYIFPKGKGYGRVHVSPQKDRLLIEYRGGRDNQAGCVEVIDLMAAKIAGKLVRKQYEYHLPEWLNNDAIHAISAKTGESMVLTYRRNGTDFDLNESSIPATVEAMQSMKAERKQDMVVVRSRFGGAMFAARIGGNGVPPKAHSGIAASEFDGIRLYDGYGHEWKPQDSLDQYPGDENLYVAGSRGLVLERNGVKKIVIEHKTLQGSGLDSQAKVDRQSGIVESLVYEKSTGRLLINGHMLYDISEDSLDVLPSSKIERETKEGLEQWTDFTYQMIPQTDLLLQEEAEIEAKNHYEHNCISRVYNIVDRKGKSLAQIPGAIGAPGVVPPSYVLLCTKDIIIIRTGGVSKEGENVRGLMVYSLRVVE